MGCQWRVALVEIQVSLANAQSARPIYYSREARVFGALVEKHGRERCWTAWIRLPPFSRALNSSSCWLQPSPFTETSCATVTSCTKWYDALCASRKLSTGPTARGGEFRTRSPPQELALVMKETIAISRAGGATHHQTLDRAHMIMDCWALFKMLAHVSVARFTLGG